ncbi:Single-stranded DNA-binding protein [Corynebacterium capitovis DSM 44611]|uniref:single-stranded DNA-binding protein n=1 Tax=Corynebacterium capitovis TaxID=131081 RepID=UPI000368AFA4|nr:single-stranded DNA-binding protein [Corynebacterium capitovis]WKD58342.1 Single-stranded DNA-binding protein [Corynebacterium capitovis DSM 44611]
MAQGDTPITVVGNLVADPELRFTPSGAAVANFRVASTPRTFNRETNQWEDGEALFLTCNVWRQAAENVAESLSKGARVIVQGRLKQRSFQTREGENRTVFEVDVDEIGPSLKYATASVSRTPREGGQGGYGNQGGNRGANSGQGQGGNPGGNQGGFGGRSQSQQGGQPQNDPWNSAPPAGGFGGMDDEPPF